MSDGAESGRFEIGIDEAGYGPLLGPLVVGAVRIDGPEGALARALCRRDARIPAIADSKRVFRGGRGMAALETAALTAVALARDGAPPATAAEFFGKPPEGLEAHPWYGALDLPLPRRARRDDVLRAVEATRAALAAEGARTSRAVATPRLEGVFNAACRRTGNKGAAHLEFVGDALRDVVSDAPDGHGRATCDRLGGRKDYAGLLEDLFPFRPVARVREETRVSEYVVRPGAHDLRVAFVVEGESAHPAVAWASCLAKAAREWLMEAYNRGLVGAVPQVRPTAGYWTDGTRFLKELAAATGDPGWAARLARTR